MLPKREIKKTINADCSPLEIRTPAGMSTASLGTGIMELSRAIRIKIPRYPREPIRAMRYSTMEERYYPNIYFFSFLEFIAKIPFFLLEAYQSIEKSLIMGREIILKRETL